MYDHNAWYDQDAFWTLFAGVLFSQQRQGRAKDEVDKIVRLLSIASGASVLDLCCGNGRHSLELAQRGFAVVGVDRTTAYIADARARAARHSLDTMFEIGDMRNYCAPARFDVVLNLFGSFGYFEDFEDDRKVVQNVYASLRPDGQFLIETSGKEILARGFPTREWSEVGDLLLLSEKTVTQNWGRVETRWIVLRGSERIEYHTSVRSYSATELASLLLACGFVDIRVYGSLDGTTYDQSAERLVIVGRK